MSVRRQALSGGAALGLHGDHSGQLVDEAQGVEIACSEGNLVAGYATSDGTWQELELSQTSCDFPQKRYWRIAHDSGAAEISFAYSSDAVSWVALGSTPDTNIDISAMTVSFFVWWPDLFFKPNMERFFKIRAVNPQL